VICGDLGPSYRQRGMTIQGILFGPPEGKNFLYSKFGYSMRLGIYAMLFAIIIGIPAGVIAALKQNTIVDYVSLFIVTIGISVPSFVMAIFLIIIFASPCMGVYCVRLVGRGGRMVFCRR
jgi:oligopeptide transport system permease protein